MSNTIRNYRNTVALHFNERGDNFTLEVPHKNKWLAIIRYLKNRGFKVTQNAYYKKQYNVLSKFHKIGYKNNVVLLMEIGSSHIKVEFGNIKNLWVNMPQSFWDNPNDDRYTKLSYMEGVAVKLEIKKLLVFCKKYDNEFIPEDESLSPEGYILKNNRTNSHIHGKVNSLEDIKKSITKDSYNYVHNSNDKNGRKIICGETKYFYDYHTRRLSVGTVWHNINNMWWVIVNHKKYNVAAYRLFDFSPNLPKRRPADKREMENILKKFESLKDYLRCHKINMEIEKLAV